MPGRSTQVKQVKTQAQRLLVPTWAETLQPRSAPVRLLPSLPPRPNGPAVTRATDRPPDRPGTRGRSRSLPTRGRSNLKGDRIEKRAGFELSPESEGYPYERIAEHYRRLIKTGDLSPGSRLPTVRDIADEWGVARPTADRAISALRLEGLVTTAGRSGTVVSEKVSDGTPDLAVAIELPEHMQVESTTVVKATDLLARELKVSDGSSVLVVRLSKHKDGGTR